MVTVLCAGVFVCAALPPLGASATVRTVIDALFTTPLRVMPWPDWLALLWFFLAWVGYDRIAERWAAKRPTVLSTTDLLRQRWMWRLTERDNRVIDGVVVQNLSAAPSFFASTTILIIGGLLAMLGTTDKTAEIVSEIPFAARTSTLAFDIKLLLLTAIFVYAFFRFTWSLRQYGFVALVVASVQTCETYAQQGLPREAFAWRAGKVVAAAASTFNDGLRAYYMSFAAVAWFFSPLIFAAATAGVIYVLYQREFHSAVVQWLNEAAVADPPQEAPPSGAEPVAKGD